MRIATLIVGLLLGLMLTIQTFAATAIGDLGNDTTTATAAGAGFGMMLLWLLGCALVIPFPLVSTVLFALSALLGLLVPTGDFADLRFHGFAAVVLTIMALLGYRGKRVADREKREEQQRQIERDNRMEMLLRQQAESANQRVCRSCGAMNAMNARFCGECGASMALSRVETA